MFISDGFSTRIKSEVGFGKTLNFSTECIHLNKEHTNNSLFYSTYDLGQS